MTKLSAERQAALIQILKKRFDKNLRRHKGVEWTAIQARLEASPGKLWTLNEMEETGG